VLTNCEKRQKILKFCMSFNIELFSDRLVRKIAVMKKREILIDQIIEFTIIVIGVIGFCLVSYGIASEWANDSWSPVEWIAEWVGVITTLIGVLITSLSIYPRFPKFKRPPTQISLYVTAPFVIICVALAIVYIMYNRKPLPQQATLGFSLLALAGSLFRTISFGRHYREGT
jgi:hypothetical protein